MKLGQIAWELGIGLFLILVGAVLSPLLGQLWKWMRTPGPLSPRDRGQLVEYVGTMEQELERTDHFIKHPKDLYLLLFRVAMITVPSLTLAAAIYIFRPPFLGPYGGSEVFALLFLAFCASLISIYIAYRFSDQKIHTYREEIRRRIEETKAKLE
jgi:hypothetical protein